MPDMNYEVRISGLVREDILQECGDVSVTTTDASTVLSGSVTDQAVLLGWLERLCALGLDVVEFHRVLEEPEA